MAHATVASLMRTIESLLTSNSPMQSLICDHREELCALREKVSSLEVFVKNFEKNNVYGEMTDFDVEVKEVASAVEYTIQPRLTETVLRENKSIIGIIGSRCFKGISNIWTRRKFRKSLQQLAKDIDHVWRESTKIQDKGKQVSKESLVHDFSSSTNDILNVNNYMVGRDDQKERLLEDLTGSYSGEPKVIPIVGMGGIGKTTLAKEVYYIESILYCFDVRAWATVFQQHNIKEILLSLLQSTIKMDDTVKTKVEAELVDMLQKSLKRKRYLIVLDDIWNCEVWDGVRRCFQNENAGSRILLTTRNNEVARDAGTKNLSMQMNFMDKNDSWNLFKSAAFSNEALSSVFETIGKKIAEKCHGLPLTIVVVAGLLKSKRAIEDWGSVATDVTSFITNDPDEQCSHVLGLSYNHLISDLKTCLLHFGIFPEDSEIPAKNLMRSWMAEGFLKFENDLEGEAEKCLQELVDRCLVLVCKKSLDGTKLRSCKVHDLIYDVYVREIQRENIFIMNDILLGVSDSECRYLSMQKMQPFKRVTGDKIDYCTYGLYRSLLTPILSLIWLRYLALICRRKLDIPPEICRLWNLQTFIVQGPPGRSVLMTFPEEIWGLMQLSHLKLPRFYLPDRPSGSVDKGRHLDFSNIQTISYLSPRSTKEVIRGIQNVKKLGIRGGNEIDSNGILNNLVHLQQLETLSFIYCFPHFPPSAKVFPATLKKLKLERTLISWSYLDIIAELPNLEVLKLMVHTCNGEEWHPIVRGFTRLKLLLIEDNNLKYWKLSLSVSCLTIIFFERDTH
ncbi:putative polygalacturonase QRT2-like [Capsicum annuum]|nr:putative polygalacturonase QRT2-like [Capsicum annuum]